MLSYKYLESQQRFFFFCKCKWLTLKRGPDSCKCHRQWKEMTKSEKIGSLVSEEKRKLGKNKLALQCKASVSLSVSFCLPTFLKAPQFPPAEAGLDCIHARVLDPNSRMYKWLPESISASENGAPHMTDPLSNLSKVALNYNLPFILMRVERCFKRQMVDSHQWTI